MKISDLELHPNWQVIKTGLKARNTFIEIVIIRRKGYDVGVPVWDNLENFRPYSQGIRVAIQGAGQSSQETVTSYVLCPCCFFNELDLTEFNDTNPKMIELAGSVLTSAKPLTVTQREQAEFNLVQTCLSNKITKLCLRQAPTWSNRRIMALPGEKAIQSIPGYSEIFSSILAAENYF